MEEIPAKKRMLYVQTHYYTEYSEDQGTVRLHQTPIPNAPYLRGIEHTEVVNGREVIMVLLETGQDIPRDELLLVADRRAKDRD